MVSSVIRSKNFKWLVLIAVVAIFLRVYAIDRLPPGLFSDEAVEGLDALDVWAGNFQIWFHAGLGREPLFVYLVALSYSLFGVTPLTTRLPAVVAGLATIPVTFFFAREWALNAFRGDENRATRLALFATALLAISFWHIQMNRNAHRDILLPLVQAIGYFLLWRGMRTRNWRLFAAAGVVLGLAVYTYSPGRFVGVLLALFFAIEFLISLFGKSHQPFEWRGVSLVVLCAIIVMLPLGIYFAQNPVQFIRRFDSASIFSASQPLAALAESVSGNLAQYVVPGAGYASLHYNLPGKPVFDLFLAPWFLAGIIIALARLKSSAHRFLLLWFIVMMVPPFLTSDMIPKGVRGLGVIPGVFMFIAIAIDALLNRVTVGAVQKSPHRVTVGAIQESPDHQKSPDRHESPLRRRAAMGLIALTLIGSTIWTSYDYFVAWANLPDLPIGFDSDYVEMGQFINRLPPTQAAYVSAEVYRHPVFMLLGKRVPTSRYFDRSTRIREFDATSTLVSGNPDALTVFLRDQSPPEDWYRRLAPQNAQVAAGKYFAAYLLRDLALPQQAVNESFMPLVTLTGYSAFLEEPRGIALYWRVAALPDDRQDMQVKVTFLNARGQVIAQEDKRFGYPPMEWALGETVVEWFELQSPESGLSDSSQWVIQVSRAGASWQSKPLTLSH